MSSAETYPRISISGGFSILSLEGKLSAFASNGGIKTGEAARQGIPLLQLTAVQKESLEQAEVAFDNRMGTGVVVRDMPGYPVWAAAAKGQALVATLRENRHEGAAFVSDTGWVVRTDQGEFFLNKPKGTSGVEAVSQVWLAARNYRWVVGNVAAVVNVNALGQAQLGVVTADLGRVLPDVDSTTITGAVANDPHISGGIRTIRHGHFFAAKGGVLNVTTFQYPVMSIDEVLQMEFRQSFMAGDGEAMLCGCGIRPDRWSHELAWDSANNGGIMAAMFGLLG